MTEKFEKTYLLDRVNLIQCSDSEFETSLEYIESDLADPDSPPFSYHVIMTKSMIEYILKNYICYYCGKAITSLTRCACGKNGHRSKIRVKCFHAPPKEFLEEFERLRHQAKAKRKSNNRRQRLKNSGRVTKNQINELLTAQDNSCYYCASELHLEGNKKFHIDHYLALLNGGKNEIKNIVLACPSCNIRKSFKEAIPFAREIAKELSDEARIKTKSIRTQVKTFRRRKINQNLD